MKKAVLMLTLAAITFASCGKENDNPGNTAVNDYVEYVFQWYNQPRATVEQQLLELGFTLGMEEPSRVIYMRTDSVGGTLYRYQFSYTEDGYINGSQMGYVVSNDTYSLENTVAHFKRYTEAQNRTFASMEVTESTGSVRYNDGGENTATEYATYDELLSALDSLTPHENYYLKWIVDYADGIAVGNSAEYSSRGWMTFTIRIQKN